MISQPSIMRNGLNLLLETLGAPDWETDAPSESEELIEVGGRLCYKSFGTELNANLTKVREGNAPYLENVLKVKHGSVLEHGHVTFVLVDVSRILTHEEVRHRAGTAFSQESMRFVRIDDMPIVPPELEGPLVKLSKIVNSIKGADEDKHQEWGKSMADQFWKRFQSIVRLAEDAIKDITHHLDRPGVPFSLKKEITTELRRIAPHGIATNIMVSANHRAWRFMLEMRTAPGADREIRHIFQEIGRLLQVNFPNLYQDMTYDGNSWIFANSKV